jgi:AraC-like DNA-binding protein
VFRRSLDSYSGCVLVTKPGYERTVTHTHDIPDQCTIFEFKNDFYSALLEQYGQLPFFRDNDLHSALLRSQPGLEYLHYFIVRRVLEQQAVKLEIDNLVVDIIDGVLPGITDYKPDLRIDARLKKNHLLTIELAKEYMAANYANDISLDGIAKYCHVSPFHFSRIFKLLTNHSPHRYLLSVRLQHAQLLLKSSALAVADIAYSSGFNSPEHFSAAFRQQFRYSPALYRGKYRMAPPSGF